MFNNWYKDKRILILGGVGFIGSNLAKEFVDLGARVTVVDGFVEFTGADMKNINGIKDKIILHPCRVEDLDNLPEIVKSSDLIIDSMAITSHLYSIENPFFDVQINLLSHLQLISTLKEVKNKKVVYLGSRGQYGNVKNSVITEETPQNPLDPQGIDKVAAERFYWFYAKRYGFNVISLRLTNCYGENQKIIGDCVDIGLVGSFIKDIMDGKTVEIYGTGKRKKSILYVKDLVKVISMLCINDFVDFEIYNISGTEVSLESLLRIIIEYVGKGSYIVKSFPREIEEIDLGESVFLDKKIREKIGEFENSDIKTALLDTIQYFQERLYDKRK